MDVPSSHPWADSLTWLAQQTRCMTTMRDVPQTSGHDRLGARVATIAVSAGCLLALCAGFAALVAVAFEGVLDFFLPG